MNLLKQILAPFASLKLTIALLLLSMLLVFAGTTAQREFGIQDVQHQFFHAWVAKIDVHDFLPEPVGKPIPLFTFSAPATGPGTKENTDNSADENKPRPPVNLNTADAEQLQSLRGVTPAKAEEIIAHRPYATDDDLRKVGLSAEKLSRQGPFTPDQYVPGYFYLPGGYSIIVVMLINLLAAHSVRFKLRWRRTGIILIHSGLILLLVGELLTNLMAVESQMVIDEGATAVYSEDIRTSELAIIDASPADHNNIVVIPQLTLTSSIGKPIRDPKLPFDVKVEKWYDNSDLRGPMQTGSDVDFLATAGAAARIGIAKLPRITGVGADANKVNMASAFVTLSKNGSSLGTYIVSFNLKHPESIELDGKTYSLELRFARIYKPYTVTLKKFTHEMVEGTNLPHDFASTVQVVSRDGHVNREVRIWMNHPLRLYGDTLYQASFLPNDKTTILQVVHNEAFLMPYVACAIGALGLILHFGIVLSGFLRRRLTPTEGTVGATANARIATSKVSQIGVFGILVISSFGSFVVSFLGSIVLRYLDLFEVGSAVLFVIALIAVSVFGLLVLGFFVSALIMALGIGPSYARNSSARSRSARDRDRYTLAPQSNWTRVHLPIAIVCFMLISAVARIFQAPPTAPFNLNGLSRVPISIEGRVQPLDSVARNFLGIVSGGKYREEYVDDKGVKHPSIEWLVNVMTQSGKWADEKVIRIDHPQIKDMFNLKEEEKLFSWNDLHLAKLDVRMTLDRQDALASDKNIPEKERDAFQHQIIDLHDHLGILDRLSQVETRARLLELGGQPARLQAAQNAIHEAIQTADPDIFNQIRHGSPRERNKAILSALSNIDASALSADSRAILNSELLLSRLDAMGTDGQLFMVPPASGETKWRPIDIAQQVRTPDEAPAELTALFHIFTDYSDGRSSDFNADLAAYETRLQSMPGLKTVGWEVTLNRFNPFYSCLVFYVVVFLLAVVSWLFWPRPLWTTGLAVMMLSLVIHTIGIAMRIYISGRPPVVSLYSAAVFIGWGVVLFSLAIEAIYRNGTGLVAGSIAGFLSLLVAAGFAFGEGDSMRQLQAVLDTNLWLATHVVCVSLGYMATILAGVLGITYILRGLLSPSFSTEDAKDNIRAVYGIVCFAMLFSFVGTILGGIWADQSGGRFWGWDPKENGAVLVVLWNALVLHSRWSGLARDRGVAILATLGNIVVGWSYVGTNLMGIGLHSYGFMSGALAAVVTWSLINLAIAGVGLIPQKYWAMSRGRE